MGGELAASNALMPQSFGDKYKMAQVLAKSGLIPAALNTPEKVCVALQWGHELALSPMVAVNNIAVINGKPTLSADIMAALVKRSPEYGGIEWVKNSDTEAECVITRLLPGGRAEKITSRFTIQDAQNAGLAGREVWKKYPRRMLKHRALSYGLKDMFPDMLAGLYTPEEMDGVAPAEPERDVTPRPAAIEAVVEEEVSEPAAEDSCAGEKRRLSDILNKYEKELDGKPYDMSCDAMASGDPGRIREMLGRCVKYLDKKGIKVA